MSTYSYRLRRALAIGVAATLTLLLPAGAVTASGVASPDDTARQAPDATYRMADAKFAVKAKTNSLGNISYYEIRFKKTPCKVSGFRRSVRIPDEGFDAAGFTYKSNQTLRKDGRTYQFKFAEEGWIDGEKFVLKQKMQVRPRGTKAWCVMRKTHVAYRTYLRVGAGPPPNVTHRTPSTTYKGPSFVLRTNRAGRVSSYAARWKRKVCGIPDFQIRFDWAKGMPVDRAGMFGSSFSFTYPVRDKKWTVKGVESGQVAKVTGFDGVTRDTATLSQRVKVRPKGTTRPWCTARKTFSGTAR